MLEAPFDPGRHIGAFALVRLPTPSGFILHGVHPVRIYRACRVQWLLHWWVDHGRVESVISIEWRLPIPLCDRIIVGEFSHR